MKKIIGGVFGRQELFKTAIRDKVSEQSVPIPIGEQGLQWLLNRHSNSITGLNIQLDDERITLSGSYRAGILNLPFEIKCKPISAEQRTICLLIEQMKPFNKEWIRKKLFNKQEGIRYRDGMLFVDCNQLKGVKAVPVGSIKDVYLKNKKLWLRIGL
ncbi:hypothetical protein [Bacillus testis]|uniref:hypothetical protein n=1 Tax=Bacillus testis TaxID=1622072 RepID=UPI00067F29A4|nr:hypothetical protein [Bacillus testis]